VILRSHSITRDNADAYEASLAHQATPSGKTVRVGYVQVGTESGWRLANNDSIKAAAREFGIDLTAVDANQSQARQIEAVREFIAQRMDAIVLSPVVSSGWDEVLGEAQAAGIPILLSDRKIEPVHAENFDLYMTFIGADFIEEGRRAMRWVQQNVPAGDIPVRILEVQGTIGATPTIERAMGFEMILREISGYEMAYGAGGDFTFKGGREVIETYLSRHTWDIDVIFCHNDDMALGAAEALEDAGIAPGRDVKIVSVDGTRDAVQAIVEGRISCVVECSPLLGPQLMKAITDLMSGKELPLRIITDEKVFTAENAKRELKHRVY
jgi:simple sugar transport system substrate-binding protein